MPFVPVDINTLNLNDSPELGAASRFTPVDINNLPPENSVPQQQYDTSTGRTILERGMEGATFGLGNRAIDSLAAVGASFVTGENPNELYKQAREMSRQQSMAQQEARPVLTPVAQIGGGVLSGLAGAGTRGGAAFAGWAGRGLLPQAQGLAGRAANLFTKSVKGAGIGAATGAAAGAGTTTGDMGDAARQGAAFGAGVGAALPVAGAAVGGAVSALTPKLAEGVQGIAELAQKYDVPLSIPQISESKPVQTLQKVSQEIPFSTYGSFRDNQLSRIQNELLKTVGVNSNKFTPEIMDEAFTRVGKQFDELGKGKQFTIPETFKGQVDEILKDAQSSATKDSIDNFNSALKRVYDNVSDDGTISGERLSFLRQELNRLSRRASSQDTSELLKDLESAVIDVMTAGDDVAKGVLSDAKQKYKNLLVLEPIAQKAVKGNISPSLLANRVSKVYGRQYTRGKSGEIGDLARISKELLPELGGSDTTQKMMAVGAGLYFEPLSTASVVGGNAAIQRGILQNQKLVDRIINKGKVKSSASLPKGKTPPTLPAAQKQVAPMQYVTLPDGTVIPRVTVPVKK